MPYRYIAPAGTPITIRDLAGTIASAVSPRRVLEEFRDAVRSAFGVKHCFFVSSGRAALTLLVRSLKEMSGAGRDEVVVPSYTCYSVPASIARAGLRIRVCDVDPRTLDYDHDKLARSDFRRVVGIVSSNLYGIPNDLQALSRIAKEQGIFLVDDAAQCMGGKVNGRAAGTFGTAGLFSLDKGKNITSIEGGIVVTGSDELARHFSSLATALPAPSAADKLSYLAKLILYTIFLRPSLYWVPAGIPSLKLGTTVYDTTYPIHSYNGLFGAMGLRLFGELEDLTRTRIKNASYLGEHLHGIPGVRIPAYSDHTTPVFLRFPVLIEDRNIRDRVVRSLHRKGIGASGSYPGSVADIPELSGLLASGSNAEGGRLVAEQIVTLPTHSYVEQRDLNAIVSTIKDLCRRM